MPRRTHIRLVTVVGAACASIVLLAGCGSDKATPRRSSSTSTSSESTPSSSPTDSSVASPSASTALEQALLAPSDIGAGITAKADTSPDSPLPCTLSAKPLFEQLVPSAKAQRDFANAADTLEVGETIAVYDTTSAKQTFAAALKGFACSSGTLGGEQITITKRSGASSTADAESAAWDIQGKSVVATAAVLRIKDKIAAMSFSATSSSANDINVEEILQRAATKVAALP